MKYEDEDHPHLEMIALELNASSTHAKLYLWANQTYKEIGHLNSQAASLADYGDEDEEEDHEEDEHDENGAIFDPRGGKNHSLNYSSSITGDFLSFHLPPEARLVLIFHGIQNSSFTDVMFY